MPGGRYAGVFSRERPGPLFRFQDGKVLSKARFVNHVRTALAQLGLDDSVYACHSFRIGAATTAAENSIADSVIQALGRWKSAAFLRYPDPKRQACSVYPPLIRTTLTVVRDTVLFIYSCTAITLTGHSAEYSMVGGRYNLEGRQVFLGEKWRSKHLHLPSKLGRLPLQGRQQGVLEVPKASTGVSSSLCLRQTCCLPTS